eukprot:symbB.v1.2.041132.t1/scaffold7850.1/size9005/1
MEGQLLVHLELRGYRSDGDMTVQINYVSDTIVWLLQETSFIPTFENGGSVSELRLVATSSADAFGPFGQNAYRLEFRFYSAADRLDVACSTCAVPSSWLMVCLASIHAHWTAEMEAQNEEKTRPRISSIAVESNPNNLISESYLQLGFSFWTMQETCTLGELRSRFRDLREVDFRLILAHPVIIWHEPILALNRERMVLRYEDVVLRLDAVVLLRLHLPPYEGEGAIYCPRVLRKRDLLAQLGISTSSGECKCYANGAELTDGVDTEVEDGDVIRCMCASPDMGHEIETLSIGSCSDGSEVEITASHST